MLDRLCCCRQQFHTVIRTYFERLCCGRRWYVMTARLVLPDAVCYIFNVFTAAGTEHHYRRRLLLLLLPLDDKIIYFYY